MKIDVDVQKLKWERARNCNIDTQKVCFSELECMKIANNHEIVPKFGI